MRRVRRAVGLSAIAAAAAALIAPGADAANTLTFRDCSLSGGLDPDFVDLSGVTVLQGSLVVPRTMAKGVKVKASESADPGDNTGHVTLKVTVTSTKLPTQTVSAEGTGSAVVSVPLLKPRPRRKYTISWAATTDNGNHVCPSSSTPENTEPKPFALEVVRKV